LASPSRRTGIARALALVLLAATLLAGCGGADTKASNAYVDQVNKVQSEFAATFERLSGQITATSTAAQDGATLQGFKAAIDRTVARLKAIKPPDKVKDLHAQLTATIGRYGTAVAGAEAGLAKPGAAARAKAAAKLAEDTSATSADFTRVIEQINQKLRQ
jgi:hypothetical protein